MVVCYNPNSTFAEAIRAPQQQKLHLMRQAHAHAPLTGAPAEPVPVSTMKRLAPALLAGVLACAVAAASLAAQKKKKEETR